MAPLPWTWPWIVISFLTDLHTSLNSFLFPLAGKSFRSHYVSSFEVSLRTVLPLSHISKLRFSMLCLTSLLSLVIRSMTIKILWNVFSSPDHISSCCLTMYAYGIWVPISRHLPTVYTWRTHTPSEPSVQSFLIQTLAPIFMQLFRLKTRETSLFSSLYPTSGSSESSTWSEEKKGNLWVHEGKGTPHSKDWLKPEAQQD